MSGPNSEARFIKETGVAAEVAALAEPVLESLGFRLVLARLMGGQSPIIEIMAERPDGTMSIEDCRIVSLNLSPVLDVHDPLPSAYRLQISSPGVDRPLVRASDFDQWAGYEAKVELKEMIDGRRRFRGMLEGIEDGEVRIEVELGRDVGTQTLGLPLNLVAEARLVLTDDLIRESLRRAKREAKAEAAGVEAAGADVGAGQEVPPQTNDSPKASGAGKSGDGRRKADKRQTGRRQSKGPPESGKDRIRPK